MRALVEVERRGEAGWQVAIGVVGPDGSVQPVASHAMDALADEPGVRPAEGNAPAADDLHAGLLDGGPQLAAICDRMRRRAPDGELRDLELLGRYLFDSLVGRAAWEAILAAAPAAPAGEPIELALAWPADPSPLHGVRWELMHDGSGFLAAHKRVAVAITRLVAVPEPVAPRRIAAPARILFALGAPLDDRSIRPGAEIVGLLRDVRSDCGALNPRILEAASLASLKATVARWRPDIVHLITHGRLDEHGRGQVRLRPDEPGAGLGENRDVPGDALMDALVTEGAPPPIVIVTGCESGASGPHTTPLAIELVERGVPIVVGMTGEVADIACRLFTRELGRALACGQPLVEAVSHARRAAYWEGDPPQTQLDWAMPAVYLSPAVGHGFVPVDASTAAGVKQRIEQFDLDRKPVFCGRRGFFERLDQVLDRASPLNVLVIVAAHSESGLGRARLLSELAIHALRDGHVPLIIRGRGDAAAAPPRTVAQLAVELVRALDSTRAAFQLPPGAEGRLVRRLAIAAGAPLAFSGDASEVRMDLRDQLDRMAEMDLDISAQNLREALQLDVAGLMAEVRASGDASIGAHSRPVLFLAGVDTWSEARAALFESVLSPKPGLDQIPAVLGWNDPGPDSQHALRDLKERLEGRQWIEFEPLHPFAPNGEDTLAYQWLLLNPWSKEMPGIADRVWTEKRGLAGPEGAEPPWCGTFRVALRGMPKLIQAGILHALVADSKSFESADDESVLGAYLEQQR